MAKRPLRTTAPSKLDSHGNRIRFARIERDMSQAALAKAIAERTGNKKTTKSLVSQWERGIVQNIQNETSIVLAQILGYRHEWLVRGTPPRKAEPNAASPKSPLQVELLASVLERMMKALGSKASAKQVAAATAASYEAVLADRPK